MPSGYCFLRRYLCHCKQAALAQAAIRQGKDTHQGIIAVHAFFDALVIKEMKRLIENPLIEAAVIQRALIRQLIFVWIVPEQIEPAPEFITVIVVIAAQHFFSVQPDGSPPLPIEGFMVSRDEIADMSPKCGT